MRVGESGVFRRNQDISHQREFETSGCRHAVDSHDDRPVEIRDRPGHVVLAMNSECLQSPGMRFHGLEVQTRAKGPAVTGENHNADLTVRLKRLESLAEFGEQFRR